MRFGIIADDFTGAVDICGFLKINGMNPVLLNNISQLEGESIPSQYNAIVISMKIRSCKLGNALEMVEQGISFLQNNSCDKYYYKYCSTFDSSNNGNIGQLTDLMMSLLGVDKTVICPALPVNKRTVYKGYLFAGDSLLEDSSMRNHPITPMRKSRLSSLMEKQFSGKAENLYLEEIRDENKIFLQKKSGFLSGSKNYLICDAISDSDLDTIAYLTKDFKLLTGGSGLAGSVAKMHHSGKTTAENLKINNETKGVIISGSCSEATNRQVIYYKRLAPYKALDTERIRCDESYIEEIVEWVISNNQGTLKPIISATKKLSDIDPNDEAERQISLAIEEFIGKIARVLFERGVRKFIVAGGETSGIVVESIGINKLQIGPQIAPGISWISGFDNQLFFALKSGNFGSEDFFEFAQETIR